MIKAKHTFAVSILLITGTLILSSCTNTMDLDETHELGQDVPLTFSTYMSQSASTRVAATGSITDAQSLAQKGGFGVFGYYTEGTTYTAGQTDFYPNFFNNQLVKGTDEMTPVWSYAPIKYWPNNNSQADNAGATGENKGLVSFFAYAPYTEEVGTTGITAMPSKTTKGDPTLTYKLASDGVNVDLLWGTSGTESSIAGTWDSRSDDNTGETLSGGNGKVNANLTKQKTDGKVKFAFKHALAKLGGSNTSDDADKPNGLQVMLDIDNYPTGTDITGGQLEDDGSGSTKTKVTIESIQITNDLNGAEDGLGDNTSIKSEGSFNLATGVWTFADDVKTDVKIDSKIGKTVGTDGVTAVLADALLDPGSEAGMTTDGTTWAWTQTGVTTTAQNVYKEETNPIVLIPGTKPKFLINIVYYVNTKDPNLEKHVSRVKNIISKVVTFENAVEMNKMYNIVLHLGLTVVKFDVTVDAWEIAKDGDGQEITHEVNLPVNVSDGSTPVVTTHTKTYTDATDNSKTLTIERDATIADDAYPEIGDTTKDTPDGDYILDDNNIYKVEDGKVVSITPVQDEDDSDAHQQVDKSDTGVNASTGEAKRRPTF